MPTSLRVTEAHLTVRAIMQKIGKHVPEEARRALLLVDPDPLLRWSIERHLGAWFHVVAADSPNTALSCLRRTRFDAVVLSNDPPESMREIEVVARQANPSVRIVRLTTHSETVSRGAAVDCVEKPFDLDTLTRVLGVRIANAGVGRNVRG